MAPGGLIGAGVRRVPLTGRDLLLSDALFAAGERDAPDAGADQTARRHGRNRVRFRLAEADDRAVRPAAPSGQRKPGCSPQA